MSRHRRPYRQVTLFWSDKWAPALWWYAGLAVLFVVVFTLGCLAGVAWGNEVWRWLRK